jgi:hypothetical protein
LRFSSKNAWYGTVSSHCMYTCDLENAAQTLIMECRQKKKNRTSFTTMVLQSLQESYSSLAGSFLGMACAVATIRLNIIKHPDRLVRTDRLAGS